MIRFGWAPTLQPCETLYSWCATVHRASGNRSSELTAEALTGIAHAARYHEVPQGVEVLLPAIGDGRTLAELLRAHTTAGFYLPFAEGASRELAAGGPRMGAGLKREAMGVSRTHTFRTPLRYCPSCCAESIEAIGRAFWCVHHQLPGALACTKHGEALHCVQSSGKRWLLPHDGEPSRLACDDSDREIALALAELAAAAFSLGRVELQSLRAGAIFKLRELGIVTSQHGGPHGRIQRWFRSTRISNFCANPQYEMLVLAAGDWIAPMLWRQKRSHGLLWIVLWAALHSGDFAQAASAFAQVSQGRLASGDGQFVLPCTDLMSGTPPGWRELVLQGLTYQEACAIGGFSRGQLMTWLGKDTRLRIDRKEQANRQRRARIAELLSSEGAAALSLADRRWMKMHEPVCYRQSFSPAQQLRLF